MSTKTKVAGILVIILISFTAGRYTVPTEVKETKTKKTEVIAKVDKVTKKKKHTTITETTKPDGEKEKKTEITYDSEQDVKKDTDKKSDSSISKESSSDRRVTISALAGVDARTPAVIWGVSVSTPILGPIVAGIWGLTNSTFGASIGLRF